MSKKIWGILFLIIIFLLAINYKNLLKLMYPVHYEKTVVKYSEKYNLNPHLIYSIIRVESKFNPYAKSKKGAMGLMQITPQTGRYIASLIGEKHYNKSILFDPDINIMYGCFYLSKLLHDFDGNLDCVIASYNGGEGNVRKWLIEDSIGNKYLDTKNIPYSETRSYVVNVKRYFKVYKFLYAK